MNQRPTKIFLQEQTNKPKFFLSTISVNLRLPDTLVNTVLISAKLELE